jgi:hypothetical protein
MRYARRLRFALSRRFGRDFIEDARHLENP